MIKRGMTTSRIFRASIVAALLTACNNNPDIGKVCEKQEDCGEDLSCDVHDGKGTCQKPHGHEDEAESEHAHDSDHEHSTSDVTTDAMTGPTTEPTTDAPTTEATTTEATTEASTGATTAAPGEVGDACMADSDCAEGLTCDLHEGAGTCQEPHDHLR